MKTVASLILIFLVLSVSSVAPVWAQSDECMDHNGSSIASLHHCVEHAIQMGHILNKGVGKSLLAKIDAALAAEGRGQNKTAANILRAFIREVQAQAGKQIQAKHAGHMVEHAQRVIGALS